MIATEWSVPIPSGMATSNSAALIRVARALRASLLVVLNHVDEVCDLLGDHVATPTDALVESPRALPELRVERAAFSLTWKSRSCYLGNTLPFRLFERLARRPGHYLPVSQLAGELWDGPRAPSTVRSVVSDLRTRLSRGGLRDLAQRIDGSNAGYYGLSLEASSSRSDSNPTRIRQRPNRVRP